MDDTTRHGIAGGSYDNLGFLAFGHRCPVLRCLCGFETGGGAAESWEEAGSILDGHLEEA